MENIDDLKLCEIYHLEVEKRSSIVKIFYERYFDFMLKKMEEKFGDTLDEESLQDIIMDSFIKKFLGSLEKGKIHQNVSGYLYITCKNACIDYIKKQRKNQKFEDISNYVEIEYEDKKKDRKQLYALFVLGLIEEEKRRCFFDNEIKGMTQKEIAVSLNLTEKQVWDRVKKAREEKDSILKNRRDVELSKFFKYGVEETLEIILQKVEIESSFIIYDYDSQDIIEALFSFFSGSEQDLARKYFLQNMDFIDFPILKRFGLREKIEALNKKIKNMIDTYELFEEYQELERIRNKQK